jgi:general transcription factor 3C polypeptide 5 (transcription factor C subunit 1)
VRWGVDPRTDPTYRKYQTVAFMSYLRPGGRKQGKSFDEHVQKLSQMSSKELEREHIFDGETVSNTGNLFQFCDLTDPLIAKILATEDIRTTCAPTYQGWYHVGTWAKVTVILKHKMNTIVSGGIPDDAIYERIMTWPELWDDMEIAATYKAEISNRQIHQEKKKEHEVMHSVRWAARNPKYAFEKMEAAADEEGGESIADAEEGTEDVEVPEDMTEIPDTAAVILNEGDREVDDADEDEDDDNEEMNTQTFGDEGGEEVDYEDDDDDSDGPLMSVRAASEGPAPFGGLYRV